MRKYKINRSQDAGGIRVDNNPQILEAIRGVLIYHTEETKCNPYNTQYGEDVWVALSFIDLTEGGPDWGYTILNKGKSNALDNFTAFVMGSDPLNTIFTLALRETHNRDFTKKWYTYSFTHEPLNQKVSELLTKVLEKNSSLPLIDPQIRAYFPEPPSLSSIIEGIKAKELEKLKLIQQIQINEQIEREVQDNIDPEIWGGMIW